MTRAALALSPLFALGCTEQILLEDGWNFHFTTDLTAETIPVADCPADLTMDWSGLTGDLQGHAVDPAADLDTLRVVRFDDYTPEQVLDDISLNRLMMQDISGALDYTPAGSETSCQISQMTFNGTPIDPSTEVCADLQQTYLFTALSGLYEYRMLVFFAPTEGEENTTVAMTSDSATLVFEPDLGYGGTIPVGIARDYELDWIGLTMDAQGNTAANGFSVSNIDRLMLARYELTIEEMEAQFFDLKTIAAEIYEADIGGMGQFLLSSAAAADGSTFGGFTGDGFWLIGLFCSTCSNPAPLFLGVVEAG